MERIQLEFVLGKISDLSLWRMLSSAEGLSKWFADDVDIKGDEFIFSWRGATESAILLSQKEKEFIRLRWDRKDAETYFELAINKNPLTNDVVLRITDFEDEDELDSEIHLIETQVETLKRVLGVL